MPAKPPKPRRRKPSAQPPAAALSEEAQGERRELAIFLRQVAEFRLVLALYDDAVVRDALIRDLAGEQAGEGVRVLTLDLREPATGRTLLARVEALAKTAAPGERIALMVVNLETCIDYSPELARPGGPGTAFVEAANFHRDLFPAACPGPLVLWMTELLERAFVTHAPDLWHWRSHVFDLRTRRREPQDAAAAEKARALPSNDFRLHPADRLSRLEEELSAYRKAGDRFQEMRVLNSIGAARLDAGDAKLAIHDFEAALSIARGIGHRSGEGNALGNLGIAYATLGDARKAIEFYEQHLGIAREVGDRRGEGNALGNLGTAYTNLGDARKAIEFHEQALVIAREVGDRRGEGNALGNLGTAYAALGDARKAIEFYEQHLVIAREIGERHGEGTALWNSADEFLKLGEKTEAIRRGEAALGIFEAIEDPYAAKARATLSEWRAAGE